MKLRRGFIKEAEESAVELRDELSLAHNDPLNPHLLSAHLDIPLHRLSTFQGISDKDKMYFATRGQNEFSAVVIPNSSSEKHILYNDFQHSNRQNSSIMHEIAHILLRHELTAPLTGNGERVFTKVVEREANELGFTLLVPKAAALYAVESFANLDLAANYFKVSKSLITYRIRKSDAHRWAYNRAKNRR